MLLSGFNDCFNRFGFRHLFLIAIIYLLTSLSHRFLCKFEKRLIDAQRFSLSALCRSFMLPLNWFFIFIAGTLFVEWIDLEDIYDLPLDRIVELREVSFIVMLTFGLAFWGRKYREIRQEHAPLSREEEIKLTAFGKAFVVFIMLFATLSVLDVFGVSLSAILAIGGAGGLAVAIAAKDIIANFFGGAVLMIVRPFHVGDWIKTSDEKLEGIVESIGWYMTTIMTFDKYPTYVPNSIISSAIVVNPSRMPARRIKHILSLRYKDLPKVPEFLKELSKMLHDDPDVHPDYPKRANFVLYGSFQLEILVEAFSKHTQRGPWLLHQQKVLLAISVIMQSLGIDFAFPTTTIEVDNFSREELAKVVGSAEGAQHEGDL